MLKLQTHLKNMKVKAKVHPCALTEALYRPYGPSNRRIALLFLDHGTRRGRVVSVTLLPLFTPWKDPVPILQEGGWAPGPGWTGAENLALAGIRSPDRPAHSQSLYRLSYRAHRIQINQYNKIYAFQCNNNETCKR